MASNTRQGMSLIFLTDREKSDPKARKLIRSHVMRGKNRAQAKQKAVREPKMVVTSKVDMSTHRTESSTNLIIPSCMGVNLCFTQLADTIEWPILADLLKFSSHTKQLMYPLEKYIMFDENNKSLLEFMAYDALSLHAMVFTVQFYYDLISYRSYVGAGLAASLHFQKTLRLLRERLSIAEEQERISDGTLLGVLALATYANFFGEYESARYHLGGLYKIVNLRGGIHCFWYNPRILIEILRCDIGTAVGTVAQPLFFHPTSMPMIPYPELSPSRPKQVTTRQSRNGSEQSFGCKNAELTTACLFLKRFAHLINLPGGRSQKLTEETLINAMAAVMYRLLYTTFGPESLDEAIRLALLGFTSNIFLQWREVRLPKSLLPVAYKNCLINLDIPNEATPRIMLWLLMIGHVSMFSHSNEVELTPLLRLNIERCQVQKWEDLRDIMKSFIWIDLIYDGPGKSIYETAISSTNYQ